VKKHIVFFQKPKMEATHFNIKDEPMEFGEYVHSQSLNFWNGSNKNKRTAREEDPIEYVSNFAAEQDALFEGDIHFASSDEEEEEEPPPPIEPMPIQTGKMAAEEFLRKLKEGKVQSKRKETVFAKKVSFQEYQKVTHISPVQVPLAPPPSAPKQRKQRVKLPPIESKPKIKRLSKTALTTTNIAELDMPITEKMRLAAFSDLEVRNLILQAQKTSPLELPVHEHEYTSNKTEIPEDFLRTASHEEIRRRKNKDGEKHRRDRIRGLICSILECIPLPRNFLRVHKPGTFYSFLVLILSYIKEFQAAAAHDESMQKFLPIPGMNTSGVFDKNNYATSKNGNKRQRIKAEPL
jgi:hypothetical protein